MSYNKVQLANGKWIITSRDVDLKKPHRACTFAFDTETQTYFDGKLIDNKQLYNKTKNLSTNEKRTRLHNVTWAWQCYDEYNGFFMTNDFYIWLTWQCRCKYMFGWCYNATFDFAQIDYEILASTKYQWKPHVHGTKGSVYNKQQWWAYESLHNDMGARYAYKLWIPYRSNDRHIYTHSVEYRDFMKLITGGLAKLLKDLNVVDNDGNSVRKLTMDYQAVNTDLDSITDEDIAYCENDVKGLYFAIKQFNETIEQQSGGEASIFGKHTNVMTAGGFAKSQLLRSLYPSISSKKQRIKRFKREHPITIEQDEWVRNNHLYRGGISYVNPYFKGKLLTKEAMGAPMCRYDVNSEYPYAMSLIYDLIGQPIKRTYEEYIKMKNKGDYEAIFALKQIYGKVKPNMVGLWYDPFIRDFVDVINENGLHLMFEREFNEMLNWYDDVEYDVDYVILYRRGERVYKAFVDENYELKAQAKREGNKTLQQVSKLNLNSSYGKLAERLERVEGHYELNEETGAVHFVREDVKVDDTSSMHVVIGALVTCVARCYILSKIREVCGDDVKHKFVYIDTDSIHAFANYDKADAYSLGGLKLEAVCDAVKYIAPKTYVDIEKINSDGTIDYDNIEVHSKGINLSAIVNDLHKKQKYKKHGKPTLRLIDSKIEYGQQYMCLTAMNVIGGKVLIPTKKYLAREELRPKEDEQQFITNYDGLYYSEV